MLEQKQKSTIGKCFKLDVKPTNNRRATFNKDLVCAKDNEGILDRLYLDLYYANFERKAST